MIGFENELIKALQKENDVLIRFCQVAEEKTEVLKKGDAAQLDHYVNMEQPLIMELSLTEASRVKILEKWNLKGKTLKEVIALTQGIEKENLLTVYASLCSLTSRLQKANDLNTKLCKARLEVLDALTGHIKNTVYGGIKEESPAGIIDRKV